MAGLAEAERACKRTGAPDDVLSRNAVLALARRAATAGGATTKCVSAVTTALLSYYFCSPILLSKLSN